MHSCWRSWGHSMIGPLHQKNGLPNQDAWLARHYSWGDVVVVSDGLGSKPHADTGAKMACRAVCEAAKLSEKHLRSFVRVNTTHSCDVVDFYFAVLC